MNTAIGLGLAAIGIVLLILGINEADSLASEFSEFFTGNPTDRSIWLMILGAGAVVGGLAFAARGGRKILKR
jgi:hypothetical protein